MGGILTALSGGAGSSQPRHRRAASARGGFEHGWGSDGDPSGLDDPTDGDPPPSTTDDPSCSTGFGRAGDGRARGASRSFDGMGARGRGQRGTPRRGAKSGAPAPEGSTSAADTWDTESSWPGSALRPPQSPFVAARFGGAAHAGAASRPLAASARAQRYSPWALPGDSGKLSQAGAPGRQDRAGGCGRAAATEDTGAGAAEAEACGKGLSESELELSIREGSPETEADSAAAAGGDGAQPAPSWQWQLPRPMLWRGFKHGLRRRALPPVDGD